MKRLTVVFMGVAALGLMTATAAQAVPGQKATGSIRVGQGLDGDRPEAGDHVRRVRDNPGEGEHHVQNFGLADAGSGR